MFDRSALQNLDWFLIGILSLILGLGLLTVYSASNSLGLGGYYFYRQLIWVGIGLALIFIMATIEYRSITKFGLPLHLIVIALLVLTHYFGTGSSFSKVERWLVVGPFYIQASEFAKYTIVLTIAHYLREPTRFANISLLNLIWIALLVAVPFILILKQPDLGTAILYLMVSLVMVFFGGLRYRIIIIGIVILACLAPLVWQYGLADYQKDRITNIFHAEANKQGTGYHITQSIIAIGGGGWFGAGYLHGTQAQLNFLPARHTDFIFALFAEEWGFIGSIALIGIYIIFITHAFKSVGVMKYALNNLLVIGATSIITLHVFTNIAMVLGLIPVVGIPLPFFSYGGSAMLSMMFGVGIILSVRCRKFEEY